VARPRARLIKRAFALAGVIALAFHLAHGQVGLGGHALDGFADNWVYDAIVIGAMCSCLARAWLVREERIVWLVLGLGLLFDATGEVYYTVAFGDSGNPPVPSLADLFYLMYYPAMYVAVVLLVRHRLERFRASTWLDGAIGATTAAAVVAGLLFEPIMRSATHGDPAAVATNLAYPIGDLILLVIVVGVFGLAGLTEHEWGFVRRHTIIGERILAAAPALMPVATLVRQSHERWDGRGYPDGIAGEQILLGARIVSVCDAFDAMTSDRPYAPAMTTAQALAQLRAGAGTQFDPAVVEAFAGAWTEHPAAALELSGPFGAVRALERGAA
jgi:hypothetical protein